MIKNKAVQTFVTEKGLFDVPPCEMDLNIGRKGRLTSPNTKVRGTISLEPFTIVAVQFDFRGTKCYRIVHDSDQSESGCVLRSDEDFVLS